MDTRGLTDEQQRQLEGYVRFLEEAPLNLMSRRGISELRDRHIPESLGLVRRLPPDAERLLDLGTGGGLPGVVIAIARPDLEVHLLDATGKKIRWVGQTCSRLGLRVSTHNIRAEDAADGPLAGWFDVVVARAVASLRELVPLAAPFLRENGHLLAVKGDRWLEELNDARAVIASTGMELGSTPSEPGEDPAPSTNPRPPLTEPCHGEPRVVMLRRSAGRR